MVSTRRSLALASGVFAALEHLFEEAELRGGKLTEQENSEDGEILGHVSCRDRTSTGR